MSASEEGDSLAVEDLLVALMDDPLVAPQAGGGAEGASADATWELRASGHGQKHNRKGSVHAFVYYNCNWFRMKVSSRIERAE